MIWYVCQGIDCKFVYAAFYCWIVKVGLTMVRFGLILR